MAIFCVVTCLADPGSFSCGGGEIGKPVKHGAPACVFDDDVGGRNIVVAQGRATHSLLLQRNQDIQDVVRIAKHFAFGERLEQLLE